MGRPLQSAGGQDLDQVSGRWRMADLQAWRVSPMGESRGPLVMNGAIGVFGWWDLAQGARGQSPPVRSIGADPGR